MLSLLAETARRLLHCQCTLRYENQILCARVCGRSMTDNDNKRPTVGGGNWRQNKRPRQGKAKNSFPSLHSIRHGKAILLTCEVGREHKAARDLQGVLEEWLEGAEEAACVGKGSDVVGTPAEACGIGNQSIEESLQSEILSLKAKDGAGARIQLTPLDTGIKGTAGVSIPDNCTLSPVEACIRFLEQVKAGQKNSRTICKLMPCEKICFGKLDLMQRTLIELVDKQFPELSGKDADAIEEKQSYMISLQRRCYESQTREEIYKALGEVVAHRMRVDLKHPDHVILVEAMKGTVGMSIIMDGKFDALKRFNLRQVQDEARGSGVRRQEKGNQDEVKAQSVESSEERTEKKHQEEENIGYSVDKAKPEREC